MKEKKQNIQWIVSLRAIACLMVVLIHVVFGWVDNIDLNTLDKTRYIVYIYILQIFIRGGVTFFLLISGSLILDKNRQYDFPKLKRNVKKMVLVLITFGLFYCFIEQFVNIKFSNIPLLVWNTFYNLICGKCWDHMWYIYMLIGLYLITPFIKSFINSVDINYQKKVMLILFVIGLVVPTINKLLSVNITVFRLNMINYICIYMLGYYISNDNNEKHDKYYFIFGILSAILFIVFSRKMYDMDFIQDNLFIVLFSIMIFKLFSNNKINFNSKILNLISIYSFGIYIIHPLFLNFFMKGFNIYPNILPIFIGETLFFIVAVVLSLGSTMLLSKLPLFSKILN